MKITTLTTLLLLSHLLWGQNLSSIAYGNYHFTDSLKNTYTITLSPNHQFEFIYDPYFDCTPAFGIYGKGQFSTSQDSVILHFDSIPHLPSSYTIDSIDNSDNTIDLQLQVTDQHLHPFTNWTLNREKQTPKRRKVSSRFFSSQFDSPATIHFQQQEKVRYVSVEQPGYYSTYIPLSLTGARDYVVQVVLRPKPPVDADRYWCNQTIPLKMISDTSIALAGWLLTRVEE
jgi:hypothetical protein